MPADLFGEGARQRRYSEAVPMRADAGAVRGVSEEVSGLAASLISAPHHFALSL
jgi:hypothetical protein